MIKRDFVIPDIRILEFRKRRVQMTPAGGQIVREIYCEPYQAHPMVLEALLGSVNRAILTRRKPHADPYYPFYYCTEATVEQLAQEAIAAGPSTGFAGGNVVDNVLTALSKPENPRGNFDDGSKLSAGAVIMATYRPLIFLGGLSEAIDPFDFVDPQLEPVAVTQVVGSDLKYIVRNRITGLTSPGSCGASATLREVQWAFSIRRLMCPSVPRRTIDACTNKINNNDWSIGQFTFPAGTVRFDSARVENKISPDKTIWNDITLHFTIRTLIDYRYHIDDNQWHYQSIGWNWMFGMPHSLIKYAGYFPVGWVDLNFGIGGHYRLQHLYVEDTQKPLGGGKLSFDDLFKIDSP